MKMPIPLTIQDAPRLPNSLMFYWFAFWELSSCRQVGFAAGPIPWVAMNDYATRYLITELTDFEIFSDLMFAMDKKYSEIKELLSEEADKAKK
jgi:hypothetical protein